MGQTILIADRNPYVRRFLQRELSSAGYEVLLAENTRQLLLLVDRHPALRLIIVDPDLPDKDVISLSDHPRLRALPILVHCLPGEEMELCARRGGWMVEKGGNSIEEILSMVGRILNRTP